MLAHIDVCSVHIFICLYASPSGSVPKDASTGSNEHMEDLSAQGDLLKAKENWPPVQHHTHTHTHTHTQMIFLKTHSHFLFKAPSLGWAGLGWAGLGWAGLG
jgi:hypothetical protein